MFYCSCSNFKIWIFNIFIVEQNKPNTKLSTKGIKACNIFC